MPLRCEVVIDRGLLFDQDEQLVDLIQHAAKIETSLSGGPWHMTLRLSDNDTIAGLHARFFDDPTPTDVITFPGGELAGDGGTYLGDVVISIETAADQASDAGHSLAREVAFLALHGLLHLCGYDDVTPGQRDAMHQRQNMMLDIWERDNGRHW